MPDSKRARDGIAAMVLWLGGIRMVLREGVSSPSGGGGGSLAGDERLKDLAPLGCLGSLGLDVGVGEAGGGDDEA
jgi:hypothetical protein